MDHFKGVISPRQNQLQNQVLNPPSIRRKVKTTYSSSVAAGGEMWYYMAAAQVNVHPCNALISWVFRVSLLWLLEEGGSSGPNRIYGKGLSLWKNRNRICLLMDLCHMFSKKWQNVNTVDDS